MITQKKRVPKQYPWGTIATNSARFKIFRNPPITIRLLRKIIVLRVRYLQKIKHIIEPLTQIYYYWGLKEILETYGLSTIKMGCSTLFNFLLGAF